MSSVSLTEVELTEDQLDGKHIVVSYSLSFGDIRVHTYTLIDCGATGYSFIDEDFARQHRITKFQLKKPRIVEVIDGRPISSGDITYLAKVTLSIHDHHKILPMLITALGYYPVILGVPWLRKPDVGIRFASDLITFSSEYCLTHCTKLPTTIKASQYNPP